MSNVDIMSRRGTIFMSGNISDTVGTVSQCKVKEQSIYHPQYVLCDTPFVRKPRPY